MTRDEVIKGLERCMGKISCNGCPLECAEGDCALTLLSEALALLKDEPKRVDCTSANHDAGGCLGFCYGENDDEPVDVCKICEHYTGNEANCGAKMRDVKKEEEAYMTRDEIIKGLECHKRAMYGEVDEHGFACNSCPYKDMESTCHTRTEGRLINDALALLKDGDMVRVVRCAECEHWELSNAEEGDYSGRCRNMGPCQNQQTDGTWFCADGAGIGV